MARCRNLRISQLAVYEPMAKMVLGLTSFFYSTTAPLVRHSMAILITKLMVRRYNSVIFSTTTANEYFAMAVPSNFQDLSIPTASGNNSVMNQVLNNMTERARNGQLTQQNQQDCIGTYSQRLVSSSSNVLVVVKNTSDEIPLASYEPITTPSFGNTTTQNFTSAWLCGDTDLGLSCDTNWLAMNPERWNLTAQTSQNKGSPLFVDHCLVQETDAQCTIQFIPCKLHYQQLMIGLTSTAVMIIVILCNLIKIGCFVAAICVRDFRPVVTLGDALATFLHRPDSNTDDLGPLSAVDVRDAETRAQVEKITHRSHASEESSNERGILKSMHPIDMLPLRFGPWVAHSKRWFAGASGLRWFLTYVL